MADFFVWRGCDISGSGAGRAIANIADVMERATAILDSESGVPDDPSSSAGPTLCIETAYWTKGSASGGQLPPGTYEYQLIPVNTCTGQTGAPIPLPDLVVASAGQQPVLVVKLCEQPDACTGVFIQRDGVVVGPVLPVIPQQSYSTTSALNVAGSYTDATSSSFLQVPGSADLIGKTLAGETASIVPSPTAGFSRLTGLIGMQLGFEGALISISNAGSPSNNGPRLIYKYVSPTEIEFQNVDPLAAVPDPNNGSVVWSMAPDSIELNVVNGDQPGKAVVSVEAVEPRSGTNLVTFSPPLTASTKLLEYSYFDIAQRTGAFFSSVLTPVVWVTNPFWKLTPPLLIGPPVIPFSGPLFAFSSLPIPKAFGFNATIVSYEGSGPEYDVTINLNQPSVTLNSGSLGLPLLVLSFSDEIEDNGVTIQLTEPYTVTVQCSVPVTEDMLDGVCEVSGAADAVYNGKFKIVLVDLGSQTLKILNYNVNTESGAGSALTADVKIKKTSISGAFEIIEIVSTNQLKVKATLQYPPPVGLSLLWMLMSVSLPRPGDLITWLDKTGYVVAVNAPSESDVSSPLPFGFPSVAVVPLGLGVQSLVQGVTQTVLPFGFFKTVYRPRFPITLGGYYLNTRNGGQKVDKNFNLLVEVGAKPVTTSGLVGTAASLDKRIIQTGTVTAASGTDLTDQSKNWAGQYNEADYYVVRNDTGEERKILTSNEDKLTLDASIDASWQNKSYGIYRKSEAKVTGLGTVPPTIVGLTYEVKTPVPPATSPNTGNWTIAEVLTDGIVIKRAPKLLNPEFALPDPANGAIPWLISDSVAPADEALSVGRPVIIDSRAVSIVAVYNGTAFSSTENKLDVSANKVVIEVNPFSGGDPEGPDDEKPKVNNPFPPSEAKALAESFGLYITLPDELSPFIDRIGIATSGDYKRLTRTTKSVVENSIWQYAENGAEQERSGVINPSIDLAWNTLNEAITASGYSGGLQGFLDRLRGPSSSTVNQSFNNTVGNFVQLTPTGFYFPVNGISLIDLGICSHIELVSLRALRGLTCDSFATLLAVVEEVVSNSSAVLRLTQKTTFVRPPSCPPDQPGDVVTAYVCVGLASRTTPVQPSELCRVFWSDGEQTNGQARSRLSSLGLTPEEVDAATTLTTSGRLLSATTVSEEEVAAVLTLSSLGQAGMDDLFDDVRIRQFYPCRVQQAHLDAAIGQRGNDGIPQRPVGTDPDAPRVSDFFPLTPQLMDIIATLSIDFCDIEAMVASLPAGEARNKVAAVLSVVESFQNEIVKVCKTVMKFIDNEAYQTFKDVLGALVTSIAADPTLACFFGSPNVGITLISQVGGFLLGASGQFSLRFSLLRLIGAAIDSVVCGLLNAVFSLLPQAERDEAQRIFGCFDFELNDIGIVLPDITLELQIGVECIIKFLKAVMSLVRAFIQEINEVLNFINGLLNGFVDRSIQARNVACNSDNDLIQIAMDAAKALGLPV